MNLLKDKNKKFTVCQPFYGFEKQLVADLGKPLEIFGKLFIYPQRVSETLWAQNIWFNAEIIPIESIGDGARKLKALNKLWVVYHHLNVRRGTLIQEKLPRVPQKRLNFLDKVPENSLGHWTLLDKDYILASIDCSSPRPHGEWEFNEDKTNPPSRAYLKLWDFFTRFHQYPNKKETCLELGAAPGGWTWVLAKFAKKVITFDRAPLADSIAKLPNIDHRIKDAFSVKPEDYPDVDWVFSDLICEPEKLYHWLQPWLKDQKKRNFCLTIKLKGDENKNWVKTFQKIPGSQVIHLYHNKHEHTFFIKA